MNDASGTVPKDILVIVISKTPEKVAHFDVAARGSRVQFIDVHRLTEGYNVAPEDTGDRKDNAKQKADAVLSTLEKLKDPASPEHQNLIAQCRVLGIKYDPAKIFVMVEDSTFTTHPVAWPYLRNKLKSFVSNDLLKKYSGDSAEPGPGAETGPIVSAAGGFLRFYNLLRRAYQETLERFKEAADACEIKNQCTVILRQLSAPADQKHIFDAEVRTRILKIADGEDYDGSNHIIDSLAYVARPGQDSVPIARDRENYIREDGPRGQVFKKMLQQLFSQLPVTSPSPIADEQAAFARHIVQPRTVRPQETDQVVRNTSLREKIYAVINREPLIRQIDGEGIVIAPFDPDNFQARLRAFYHLTSVMVAKQLIARDMFKPVVVWDDGSWKPLIKIFASLANKGMAKDFVPFTEPLKDRDITHITSSFFDCLRFDPRKYDRDRIPDLVDDSVLEACRTRQTEALKAMSAAILRERGQGYHEFIPPPQLTAIKSEGTAPDGTRFTVGHFISATIDNKTVIEQSKSFGTHLAQKGIGYVWGGMNMHAGGVAFQAYKEAGGVHAAAYSTIPIAAAETEDGRLPATANYREWSRNIYERMAGMVAASDVIVISPGGWGTLQELLALMVLKDQAPKLFANKKIVIHNPSIYDGDAFSSGLFWNRSIRAIFDVDYRNTDFSSVRDKDVFIVRNDRELNKLTDRLHKEWQPQHVEALAPQRRLLLTAGNDQPRVH